MTTKFNIVLISAALLIGSASVSLAQSTGASAPADKVSELRPGGAAGEPMRPGGAAGYGHSTTHKGTLLSWLFNDGSSSPKSGTKSDKMAAAH